MGNRVSLLRYRKRATIREIAEQAGVDKNTLVRLEKGKAVRMETLTRICAALGTTPGRQFLELAGPDQSFRVSRAAERRWEKAPDLMSATDPAEEIAKLCDAAHRWPFGWSGEQPGFNGFLDCDLYGGAVVSSVIELFTACTLRSFVGEELIYCLRGSVVLEVDSDKTQLDEGDAVCVWATKSKICGPALPVLPGQPPPLILSVRAEGPASAHAYGSKRTEA